MPAAADILDRGRQSYERYAWAAAYADLSAADERDPLAPDDLVLLSISGYLAGHDDDSLSVLERAHHGYLARDDVPRAVRCAFWLAFALFGGGQLERGGGWLARGRRLLEADGGDHVEHGYLFFASGMASIFAGDFAAAHATFDRAAGIGERFADPDLVTLARHGQGRALIRMGRDAEGKALLDEVMVAVTSGAVSPIVAGDVYCSVIQACEESFDLRRAQAWTAALSQWCAEQPDLVPYRGQCLLHRAEIMQLHGAWQDAVEEVERASLRLAQRPGRSAQGGGLVPARRAAPPVRRVRRGGGVLPRGEPQRARAAARARAPAARPGPGRRRAGGHPPRRRRGRGLRRALAPAAGARRGHARGRRRRRAPSPAPTSWRRWPTPSTPLCCARGPPMRRAPCSWPRATRARR